MESTEVTYYSTLDRIVLRLFGDVASFKLVLEAAGKSLSLLFLLTIRMISLSKNCILCVEFVYRIVGEFSLRSNKRHYCSIYSSRFLRFFTDSASNMEMASLLFALL